MPTDGVEFDTGSMVGPTAETSLNGSAAGGQDKPEYVAPVPAEEDSSQLPTSTWDPEKGQIWKESAEQTSDTINESNGPPHAPPPDLLDDNNDAKPAGDPSEIHELD